MAKAAEHTAMRDISKIKEKICMHCLEMHSFRDECDKIHNSKRVVSTMTAGQHQSLPAGYDPERQLGNP